MRKVFIYSMTLVTILGCTKVIDLELNNEENQRLVVDAWFTTEAKEHEVKLSLTTSYFQNETAPVATGATVYITDGTNNFPFNEVEPGIYKSDATAKAAFKTGYMLHIEYEGEVYEASSYVDTVPLLDSIAIRTAYDFLGNPSGNSIDAWTFELPGSGDHYLWKYYINGESQTQTLDEYWFESDEYLDEAGTEFNGWPIVYADTIYPGDSVVLEQHLITKETYDLIIAAMLETNWRGGIFDSPPANVPTNLSNGAVGFFIASAETSKMTVAP